MGGPVFVEPVPQNKKRTQMAGLEFGRSEQKFFVFTSRKFAEEISAEKFTKRLKSDTLHLYGVPRRTLSARGAAGLFQYNHMPI